MMTSGFTGRLSFGSLPSGTPSRKRIIRQQSKTEYSIEDLTPIGFCATLNNGVGMIKAKKYKGALYHAQFQMRVAAALLFVVVEKIPPNRVAS